MPDLTHIVAISTADLSEIRSADFTRLLESGNRAVDHWYIVLRDANSYGKDEPWYQQVLESKKVTLLHSEPVGISAARNRALLRLKSDASFPLDKTAVLFPDIDAWFEDCSRARILASINESGVDAAIGPYGPSDNDVDRRRWPATLSDIRPADLLTLVASAGIIFRANALFGVGYFDERLGVGSEYHAAEDVELMLRAYDTGVSLGYFSLPVLFHQYKPSRHLRVLGGCAVVFGYRELIPGTYRRRILARSFVDRTGPLPRFSPRIGMAAISAARRYRPASYAHLSQKVEVGGLLLTKADPKVCLVPISERALRGEPTTVVAAHVTAINSRKEPAFVGSFNSADFAFVDGISVALAARLSKGLRLEKLATTDYALMLLRMLTSVLGRPPRVVVVGGEEGVAEAAGKALEDAEVADVVFTAHGFHGDFGPLVQEIEKSNVDVLILGLGMPREAVWVSRWGGQSGANLILTCGGWLRLLANLERRAPKIWQKLQVEWLWRVLTDPKRTIKRYALGVSSLFSIGFRPR